MSQLRKCLDKVIDLYVAEFEKKHDCYLEFWVADDKTGVACFGDHFFNLADIVFDIDNNCPARAIFDWQNRQVENNSKVDFKNYLKGLR